MLFGKLGRSSPKSKFWGRISGGRPRGYPGGRPGAKTSVKPSNSWKAQTYMTPWGFKETSVRKSSGCISFSVTREGQMFSLPKTVQERGGVEVIWRWRWVLAAQRPEQTHRTVWPNPVRVQIQFCRARALSTNCSRQQL